MTHLACSNERTIRNEVTANEFDRRAADSQPKGLEAFQMQFVLLEKCYDNFLLVAGCFALAIVQHTVINSTKLHDDE